MRPISFLFIFVFCLALVLFSLENSQPVTINVFREVKVQAPLCIELIATMGLGAILAWLFSAWSRFLRMLENRKTMRAIKEKETRIQQLQKDLEKYKVETADQPLLLPASPEKEDAKESVATTQGTSVK